MRELMIVTLALASAGCACPVMRSVRVLDPPPKENLGWMGSEKRLPLEVCRKPEFCGPQGRLKGCTLHPMQAEGNDPQAYSRDQRAVVCERRTWCPGGRAPAEMMQDGLLGGIDGAPDAIAAWWAEVAQLEAVSVASFTRLARELEAHGAPQALVQWAAQAARDEVEHARVATHQARRLGAPLPPVPVLDLAVRPLETVATENEVEGAMHERWSATQITHQAAHAPAPLRLLLEPIARDERRHAQLADAVRDWTRAALGPRAARRTRQAAEEARERLLDRLDHEPSAAAAVALGLPSATRSIDLARGALHLT